MNRMPDMRLYQVIKYGGRSMNFSHIMPQWQHILSGEEIVDIISHIRALAYPPYLPRSNNGFMMPDPRKEKQGNG